MSLRSQFAKTMLSAMDADDKVIVVLGDIGVHAFREHAKRWPTRVINGGIAEFASVGMCAGLAMGGYLPVYSTIDSFLVRRAYEALYINFGLQRLPGVFVTVGGSHDYAKLGPTHQCAEGTTLMAQIPGMHIRMPVNESTVDLAITNAVRQRQLSYIRLEESLVAQDASSLLLDNVPPHLGANNDITLRVQR